jgi:hypothetical protein
MVDPSELIFIPDSLATVIFPSVPKGPVLYWVVLSKFIGAERFPPVGPTVGYVKAEIEKDKRNTEANNPNVRPIRFGIFLYIIFLNSKF